MKMKKIPILFNVLEDVEAEIIEERTVDEKLGTKEMDINVKWGQAAPYVNINDRAYRPELLEREIKKINERIKSGDTVWGASYHPADGLGTTGDISHMWKKVWMEKDGTCKGTLTLLPTTEGKNVQVLVQKGRLGISSRGFGTVTEKETKVDGRTVKYNDVNDDFRLVNPGDFVVSPSVEGAGNIAESIKLLESELNKGLDLGVKNTNIGDKTMKFEDLKKEQPELHKEIEDERVAAKTESETKDAKIVELETEKADAATKIAALEAEKKEFEEWKENALKDIRNLITSAGAIEDVLPEEEPKENKGEETNEEAEAALKKVQADLVAAEEKITTLEATEKGREDDKKTKKDEAELQADLKAKVDEILEKEEYKVYATEIRDLVTEDEKIKIESVEKVEETLKAEFERVSRIKVGKTKEEMIKDIDEKGKIKNPEGGEAEDLKAKLTSFYQEAVAGGFKGTFDEWKKTNPLVVESASN